MTPEQIAELERLRAAANLSELSSTHIINEGYTHLANLTTAPDKPCFVVMNRKEIMDWFAAIHNAFPALIAHLREVEGERDTATDTEAGHWIGIIRNLDPENLCDVFDGMGVEENLRQWLAARDARLKREGAAEWLENAAREGGYYERSSEGMLEEAKQLREGKV